MRFVSVSLLCLAVLGTGVILSVLIAFGQVLPQTHADAVDESVPKNEIMWLPEPVPLLTAFRWLEQISPDATHADIASVAKTRFGVHPLAKEWTELCLRLSRDGKGVMPDLRRFAELEIQLLTEVDAEKHAEQIAAFQGALKELDSLSNMPSKQGKANKERVLVLPLRRGEEKTTEPAIYKWKKAALEHLAKFDAMKEKDRDAARTALLKIATIRFGTHPLAEEWIPLYFRLSCDGRGRISDMKRLAELEIRILTDIDAENRADQIHQHRQTLKKFDSLVELLNKQGKNPEEVLVDF